MKKSSENTSEKLLERVSEENPASVYSVNFTQIIGNDVEKKVAGENLKPEECEKSNNCPAFFGMIFKRRNEMSVAAIFAIGILHFVFQLSFIRSEKPQLDEAPVKIEQVREQTVETKPIEFEAKKVNIVLPEKTVPTVRRRQPEIVPSKTHFRKKDADETRTARLRRAEKILTGI